MAVFRSPAVYGLDRPVVPFYRKCEMAGTITNLYLFQKPARIVSESGSLVKILVYFLEKRETFCHDAQPECGNGRGTETSPFYGYQFLSLTNEFL